MLSYHLPLNKAVLVFFPPQDDKMMLQGPLSRPRVVQVMIKQEAKEIINELSAYFFAQEDITKAVENILLTNMLARFPTNELTLKGKGYILHGIRKEWIYGEELNLTWGGTQIYPGEDKWVFRFELDHTG